MKVVVGPGRLCAALGAVVLAASTAHAEVQLLGVGTIPGDAIDNTGLSRLLEDGVTPNNQVGGFGSGIAYTGLGNLYIAVPDRGPADGATTYTDRAYTLRIDVRRNFAQPGQYEVGARVVGTTLLRSSAGLLTGFREAFDATNSASSRRFDPEGIRVASCGGTFFVSDEYGPFLYEFSASGLRKRALGLPSKHLIDLPATDPNAELQKNAFGRQANRGMEGLAISPDGSKLYGMLQSPLLQDGGLDLAFARVGTNVRIVEIDVATGALREFLYVLDNGGRNGVSEILAVNDHEFLVLERDGRVGSAAQTKKIFRIDLTDATDIRDLAQLPSLEVPAGVTPVAKELLIDLLSPAFGLAGPTLPEKFEGLAFGPDLPDGRHLLLVTTDNDFQAAQPSRIYVFAVPSADLPDFEPQSVSGASCK